VSGAPRTGLGGALAIVVIGRNEGERLRVCLTAALGSGVPVVYVDSGSGDGSPELARGLGAMVHQLDPARPFTAARGRNEGLERALELLPGLELVQFLDGDCELLPGWLERGQEELRAHPSCAAVCGRVRERHRDRSAYNRLCDLEWDAPAGESQSCGGNALMRVRAFREAGGFRPGLIGGEEPELCLRLRRLGWRIRRCAEGMALHDADMTRLSQWWRRAFRSGFGYAEGFALHGGGPERFWRRENRSILLWGALLPLLALLLAWPTRGGSAALFLGYPALGLRIYRRAVQRGLSAPDARLQAFFLVLAKLPQALGQVEYLALRALGLRRRAIDWRASS